MTESVSSLTLQLTDSQPTVFPQLSPTLHKSIWSCAYAGTAHVACSSLTISEQYSVTPGPLEDNMAPSVAEIIPGAVKENPILLKRDLNDVELTQVVYWCTIVVESN
jgi:hypothetical protein